jgi:hypothetical protein
LSAPLIFQVFHRIELALLSTLGVPVLACDA